MTYSVALLLGSDRVPIWFRNSLRKAEKTGNIDFEQVIVAGNAKKPNDSTYCDKLNKKFRSIVRNPCWSLIQVGGIARDYIFGKIPELQKVHITDGLSIRERDLIYADVEKKEKYRITFSENIINRMSSTDIAIHLGIGILSGDILDVPEMGVWGYHHGDVRKYRGGPPGFWEYINEEDYINTTLQKYDKLLDGGSIIAENRITLSDALTWRETRQRLCQSSIDLLADTLLSLDQGGITEKTPESLGKVYSREQINCKITQKYILINFINHFR
jgi:hypothetical protein